MLPNWLYGKSLKKLQEILNSGGQTAAGVSYSNTESGLEATNAQTAIDEVVEELDTKAAQSALTTLSGTVTTLTGTVNGKVAWSDYAQSGAVNYCNHKASSTTTTDGAATFTWTVNDDKSITVSALSYPVTLASLQKLIIWNPISAEENKVFVNKEWRLTGCPDNGCMIELFRVGTADGSAGTLSDTGEGLVFEWLNDASGTKVAITLSINSGTTLTEAITFYPMIAPVNYTGDYVPPAKTNAELTEELSGTSTTITENGISVEFNKWGKTCTLTLGGAFNAAFNYDVPFLNIPSGFAPKYNSQILTTNKLASLSDRVALNIKADRTITVAGQNVAIGDALRGTFTYITA